MKAAKRLDPRRKINFQSESFSLSNAKTYLGRLVEKAGRGQTVCITRGTKRFLLQEVPPIDPVPVRPPGYFAESFTGAEIRELNLLAKASVVQPPAGLE
jgi:hypothetical protein